MTVATVVGCWCVGSLVLAPLIGRAIRVSRSGTLRAAVERRGRSKRVLVA